MPGETRVDGVAEIVRVRVLERLPEERLSLLPVRPRPLRVKAVHLNVEVRGRQFTPDGSRGKTKVSIVFAES